MNVGPLSASQQRRVANNSSSQAKCFRSTLLHLLRGAEWTENTWLAKMPTIPIITQSWPNDWLLSGFCLFFFFLRFKNNWCSKNWIVTLWTSKDVSLSQISYVFKTIYLSSFRDIASYWKVVEHNMMCCL